MIYLDTSAFVKLVRAEPETDALRAFLGGAQDQDLVSSVLLATETRRAVQRRALPSLARADLRLTRVRQVDLTHAVVETAGRLPQPDLRTLEAVHVATALLLRDEISNLVTYDVRMAAAATAEGLPVVTPVG